MRVKVIKNTRLTTAQRLSPSAVVYFRVLPIMKEIFEAERRARGLTTREAFQRMLSAWRKTTEVLP